MSGGPQPSAAEPDEIGDWWEPIATAPKAEGRLLLSFPAVDRDRMPGEPKPKGMKKTTWEVGRIRRPANVSVGVWTDNGWSPGKHALHPFFDQPSHWMYLPDPAD